MTNDVASRTTKLENEREKRKCEFMKWSLFFFKRERAKKKKFNLERDLTFLKFFHHKKKLTPKKKKAKTIFFS